MSYQPGRPTAPTPGQLVAPPYGGVRPQQGGIAPQRTAIAPQHGGVPPISSTDVHAPTLGQFWRSDVRRTRPDARRVRWPGLVAFLGGLAALILLILGAALASVALASVALAVGVVAGLFALIAIIAGLGRVLGLLGLLLALAGNVDVVAPLFGLG